MKTGILAKSLLLGIVYLVLATESNWACLWPLGESMAGGKPIAVESLSGQALVVAITTHEGREYWEKVHADILGERQVRGPRITSNNNLAVVLLHLGKIREAIEILEKAEKESSNQYYVAANLGTAYELNGENEKALKWIKKAMERNPESHYDTEWLHVKILEAKIAISQDPRWLEKHSVLGIELRPEKQAENLFVADHTGKARNSAEIEKALAYRLHERLEFTPKPDAVVADLLFDFSKVLAITRGDSHSSAMLEIARTYGPDQEKILQTNGPEKIPEVRNDDKGEVSANRGSNTIYVAGGAGIYSFRYGRALFSKTLDKRVRERWQKEPSASALRISPS